MPDAPRTMTTAQLIVYERRSRFAPTLRAALAASGPAVAEARSTSQCLQLLAERPASLVLAEAHAANLPALIELLELLPVRFPLARLAVLLDPAEASLEALLREAGAIDALYGLHEAPRAARLALRQQTRAPQARPSFREATWQRLPWAAHATKT